MARLTLPRALSRLRCVRLLQRRWKTKHFVWFAVAFAVMLAMTSLWRDRRIPVIIVEEHHEGQCYELLLKRRFLLRFMVGIYFQTINYKATFSAIVFVCEWPMSNNWF